MPGDNIAVPSAMRVEGRGYGTGRGQLHMDMGFQGRGRGRRSCLFALPIGLLTWSGCGAVPGRTVQQIKQADQAYRLARYGESDRLTSTVIQEHPASPFTAEALYLRGLSRLKQDQRPQAEQDLEKALFLCRQRDLEVLILVQLANIAFDDDRYRRAAQCYQRAVDESPLAVPGDTLWYRYGLSLQRSGDFPGARFAFQQLLARHPGSSLVQHARRRMSWRFDHFTIQCGAFAEERSAQTAAQNLRQAGIDASVSARDPRIGIPYAVYSGRYRAYADAQSALTSVRQFQHDAFVVP